MKNKSILLLLLFWATGSCGMVFGREVIAQWSGYKYLRDSIVPPSHYNSYNKDGASLQRINGNKKLLIDFYDDGFPSGDLWHKEETDMEKYWLATFSSKHYKDIVVTLSQRSSSTGPENFKLQYKTGVSEWKDLGVTLKMPTKGNWSTPMTISLPAEAENQEEVSFRSLQTNYQTPGSSSTTGAFGANRIDLSISGILNLVKNTTWEPQNGSTEWNEAANWSNGIPDTLSNAIFYSGSSSYPVLQSSSKATCDTVFFRSEIYDQSGEIANTCFLQYKAAVVELLPSRNRYHLIAPPLSGIYSGDFFTKASFHESIEEKNKRNVPGVWMKLYQTKNPEKATEAKDTFWSGYFNTLDYPIGLGSGLCIWVDDQHMPKEYLTPEYLSFTFPKDSSSYCYFDESGQITKKTSLLDKTSSHRFVYETAKDYNPADGSFSIEVCTDVSGNEVFGSAIVGNPFMCHLNFSKFQAANEDKIESVYRIWGGDSFDNSLLYGDSKYPLNENNHNYIAPMQAFVVIKKEGYKEKPLGTLSFTPDMAETGSGSGLRSASLTDIHTNTVGPKKESVAIEIHPNQIRIESTEDNPIRRVEYYNLQGKLFFLRADVNTHHLTIPQADLPSTGILRIITQENTTIRKIIF